MRISARLTSSSERLLWVCKRISRSSVCNKVTARACIAWLTVAALVGLAVAYFAYRHNQPLALRSALYPLMGERWVKGAAGHAVDGFGMFVTLLGLVTNLGIGSMQVSSGLENLFGMEHSNTNLLIVIIVMSTVATIAAVSGVENGIRRLSNLNIILFSGLLIFVLLFGPTLHLLNGFVQNTGDYLNGIVMKTFDLYVYEGDSKKTEGWLGLWTLFYWAWWISWAPFVGMFIARISRGRTVRELVAGVLLIPLGFTLAWLSIFGNSAFRPWWALGKRCCCWRQSANNGGAG